MTAPLPSAWRPYKRTSRYNFTRLGTPHCSLCPAQPFNDLDGWFWRPLTGTGQRGRRTEAICPGCAEGMGVEK